MVLVNPNTSTATTRMMASLARRALAGTGLPVRGVTAAHGPTMLTDPATLRAAVPHTVAAARAALAEGGAAALIVGAFGDPGVAELRAAVGEALPVVGIGEAALAEAAADGRRFGVATTTPLLADAITGHVERLGLGPGYTGTRCTAGDPRRLTAHPEALLTALEDAVRTCVLRDGAEAVVIGGGPLGDAAAALRTRLPVPVIAPIPAACTRVARLLAAAGA
ncbi:aspartate/glutamate racemase family protein [Streptomyces sp. NBC_01268]|uniref:aspartate/glutamate racemase family protein n=1 Tax=Streptomyces sp. NBC_01268 TaxID=2903806 RepID=UPI002E335454|nr:aspartate/glutamate racemase family protein [Streptomyces sp. NBC_01268]